MKNKIIIKPDKIIEQSHGDNVEIFVSKHKVDFYFYCDGTGNDFSLTKKELREMLK